MIGGFALGQSGGTNNEPAAPESNQPLEQRVPETDRASGGIPASAEAARYHRLNAPYYEFLGIDRRDSKVAGVRPKLPPQKVRGSVAWAEFLIVTVADPIDTHLSYRFDQQIETLHRVFAAEGYVIDRFYLPWEKGDGQDLHRTEPGLLLYRNQPRDPNREGSKDKTGLLAVYLVGETPTGGIQSGAFRFAVHHINEIGRQAPARPGAESKNEFMVSGPTFSGAADSLARAIRDCRQKAGTGRAGGPAQPAFRVITGSAISVNRNRFLRLAGGGDGVSIHATVASNEQLSGALIEYVTQYATRSKPVRIAWLTESGTGYGLASTSSPDKQTVKSRRNRAVEIINFQFPVNIARVRAAYQEERRRLQSTQLPLGPDQYRVPIPFNEDQPAFDLPPMQTPTLTAPSAELMIGQILTTIRDEGIEYVAISASDIRDPVFLTELIKEQSPDAQVLLITSDLLHLHSEYRATMRGTLVAGTYSLCPEDQDWCFPFQGRRQKVVLSNQSLYGLFNAVVFLRGLQRGDLKLDGTKKPTLKLTRPWRELGAKPLAYGMPLQEVDRSTNLFEPPVWISMIGSAGIRPLACMTPPREDDFGLNALRLEVALRQWSSHEAEGASASEVPRPSFDPRIAPSSKLLMWFWVCLGLVYLGSALGFFASPWARPLAFKRQNEDKLTRKYLWPRRCFRAMTTLALLVATTLAGAVAFIPFWLGEVRLDWLNRAMMVLLCGSAAITASGLVGMLFLDVFRFVFNDAWVLAGKKLCYAPDSKQGRRRESLVVFLAGLAVLAIAVLGILSASASDVSLLLFFLTWSDIWNGISLFLPVQLLAGAIVLLSHGMLLQMDMLSGGDPNRGVNLVPRPVWPPKKDLSDPETKKVVVRQILYPIATRLRRGKSIVLHISALIICSSWLVSLFLRTDFTEPFSGWLCFVFILGCGYWGVRFVKTLEICHALARELRGILKTVEPRERYTLARWREIVGRLGPARRIGLRMFWQYRPHWNLKRGELSQAYGRLITSQRRRGVDDPQTVQYMEEFFAMHVELYIRQMFVHLVALVTGLVVTGGLLFLTAQCFPFNSEPLMQLSTTLMLVALAILILWYYMQFDRDELLSVFDGTEPDQVEWNWSLIRTTAPAVALGLVGLLSQAFPEMWTWLRGILQPLAHSTG